MGMGRFYYEQFQTARRLFESASDALKTNFTKLCFEGPEQELMLTQNAQPAIVLVSCTAWFCLKEEMDLSFIRYCAGHSVGEYSALTTAGVLPLNTALKAVRQRGLYMSSACPPGHGGMSALIGPTPETAKKFCQWVEKQSGHKPLETANFNTPEQTVLSGAGQALSYAHKHYQNYNFDCKKTRLIPLKVSAPFHSSLMAPAREQMAQLLKTLPFAKPDKLIVQNTIARAKRKPETLRKNLIEQVKAPMLWWQSMQYLLDQGCSSFLELGEGKVLAGLMKKIDSSKTVCHFHSLKDIQTLQNLKN